MFRHFRYAVNSTPTRMRIRSRGSKLNKRAGTEAAALPRKLAPKLDVRAACTALKPHLDKIARLRGSCIPPTQLTKDEKGWQLVPGFDAKLAAADLALAEADMKAVVSSLKQGLGMAPIKFTVPIMQLLTNTAANVCGWANNIDPSATSEWSALASLYDEFRFLGADTKIIITAPLSVAASNNTGWFAVVFDPEASSVSLGSTIAAAQFSHHHLAALPTSEPIGALATGSGNANYNKKPIEFRFRVKPQEELAVSSGSVFASPGYWMTTTGAIPLQGSYRYYFENTTAISTQVGTSVSYFFIELRSRT